MILGLLGVLVVVVVVLAVLRRRFVVVRIEGISMEPTFRAGDRVLVRRTRLAGVSRGQVVIFRPPNPVAGDPPWMVKRVAALPGDPVPAGVAAPCDVRVPPARLVVLGDNSDHSYDSRRAGYIAGDSLLGVVVRALA